MNIFLHLSFLLSLGLSFCGISGGSDLVPAALTGTGTWLFAFQAASQEREDFLGHFPFLWPRGWCQVLQLLSQRHMGSGSSCLHPPQSSLFCQLSQGSSLAQPFKTPGHRNLTCWLVPSGCPAVVCELRQQPLRCRGTGPELGAAMLPPAGPRMEPHTQRSVFLWVETEN